MNIRDPEGVRAQKNWELPHQAELIRQYMTLRSFTQIAQIMRTKLEWSYKTYANRYRDWLLPVDRIGRELAVIHLYALVTGKNPPRKPKILFPNYKFLPPIQTSQPIDIHPSPCQFNQTYSTSYSQSSSPDQENLFDQMMVSTATSASTLSDGSGWSGDSIFDDPLIHPLSASTCFGSSSQVVQYPIHPQSQLTLLEQEKGLQLHPYFHSLPRKSPTHDFKRGLWNSTLRVIPCDQDHSRCSWEKPFPPCQTCGFSQCHALMIQAQSISPDIFAAAVSLLRDFAKPDFAGNRPMAFLMAAGVTMEYFNPILWDLSWAKFSINVFSQSPLHVLNAQNLGEQLVDLLEWFPEHLQRRDAQCRTFLHYLFQQPLKPGLYFQVLQRFPNASYHLHTFDTSGKLMAQVMQEAACRARSAHACDKILAGLVEMNIFFATASDTQIPIQPFGFHEIIRESGSEHEAAATPFDYFNFSYHCRICQTTNVHSDSCYDRMLCACQHGGIDRNAADEQGWTPAHLLITRPRFTQSANMRPETPVQTTELFRLLLFSPDLNEALHVIDPLGNSLVYNIATRGYSAILEYVLGLEEEGRRGAMVNSVGRTEGGEERSVLQGVDAAILECEWKTKTCADALNQIERDRLTELYNGLKLCRIILKKWGAELQPSVQKRWTIF
ncbi:hypothetical protein K3495_g5268 [Podosphaera aphanis]|nr:hypothetical protein K3495_g5268 [Podosphaera aphanis]